MPDPDRWAARFAQRYELTPGAPLKRLWDAAASRGAAVAQRTVPGESGRTFKDDRGWNIWLEEQSSYRRTRFTLAHEIGHFLLGAAGVRVHNEERWADSFASELLMPARHVKQLINGQTLNDEPTSVLVERLSSEYAVTEACVIVRLNTLGVRRAGCVSFRRFDRRWALYSTLCLPQDMSFALRSSDRTSTALDMLAITRKLAATLPLVYRGEEINLEVSLLPAMRRIVTFIELTDLLRKVPNN